MCMRVLRFFIGGVGPRYLFFFPSPGFRYIRYIEVGQAPGLFRTPKAYPQPPLVHECALAYFRGNLTDYAHAWTGMNYLPQAPQNRALRSRRYTKGHFVRQSPFERPSAFVRVRVCSRRIGVVIGVLDGHL